ncbi:MAG: SCO family protein [Alphaproteobacteria bacterium]|nr:SCO family protein [Alphaproteobacteria bacterium]
MTSQRRFVLVGVLLGGIVILTAGAFLGLGLRQTPKGAAGTLLASAIGGPFRLVDQNGRTVTDADLKGKWSLIYFGYTHCPDACPTTLNEIAIALDDLGPKRDAVRPVFITVDPERDTPQLLKGYVENFGPTFVGLTGTAQQVDAAARAYRVYYQKVPGKDGGPYLMDHSSIVYLLDRNGRFVTHFTHEAKAEAITAAVKKLL